MSCDSERHTFFCPLFLGSPSIPDIQSCNRNRSSKYNQINKLLPYIRMLFSYISRNLVQIEISAESFKTSHPIFSIFLLFRNAGSCSIRKGEDNIMGSLVTFLISIKLPILILLEILISAPMQCFLNICYNVYWYIYNWFITMYIGIFITVETSCFHVLINWQCNAFMNWKCCQNMRYLSVLYNSQNKNRLIDIDRNFQ